MIFGIGNNIKRSAYEMDRTCSTLQTLYCFIVIQFLREQKALLSSVHFSAKPLEIIHICCHLSPYLTTLCFGHMKYHLFLYIFFPWWWMTKVILSDCVQPYVYITGKTGTAEIQRLRAI